MSAMT